MVPPECTFCRAPDPTWQYPVLKVSIDAFGLPAKAAQKDDPYLACSYCHQRIKKGEHDALSNFIIQTFIFRHDLDDKEIDQERLQEMTKAFISFFLMRRCGPAMKF